ncbi:Transmembrane protein [Trema orientale]|uniref:Transmembrane protein n=1 Tax=Trema orientale TaxID=63057 RepID=A0A2P5G272_TREOI|nr:Transmembrane protein [Trema orientale]
MAKDGSSSSTITSAAQMRNHAIDIGPVETPAVFPITGPVQDVQYMIKPIHGDRSSRTALHHAAITGDWRTAEAILREEEELLNSPITDETGETVLHVAVGAIQVEFVEWLVKREGFRVHERDRNGNTAYCTAAIVGSLEIIRILRRLDPQFPSLRDGAEMTPLHLAASYGRSAAAWDLYNETRQYFRVDEEKRLFFTCIDNEIYDLALKLLKDYCILQLHRARDGKTSETALHVLARRTSAFASQGIFKRLVNSCPFFGSSSHTCFRTQALKLLNEILSRVSGENWDAITALIRQPQNLILEAAEVGNYDFLDLLIQSFPALIREKDDKNYTIFHVAIIKRHINILKLIHRDGLFKSEVQLWNDEHGNNILHLASKLPTPDILFNDSGGALPIEKDTLFNDSGGSLPIEKEFSFLKEVGKIFDVPRLWDTKNSDNRTPKVLFSLLRHKSIMEGEKRKKKIAASCIVIGTLIVPVVYSASLTVPGGNNTISNATSTVIADNSHTEQIFIVLAAVNTNAVALAITSILTSFSVLISCFLGENFVLSMSFRFKFGLISLLLSVVNMMLSYCIASVINYVRHGPKWVQYFIYSSPSLPIITLIFFLLIPLLKQG